MPRSTGRRLTDRRVLIVLDDAKDAAQVRPLLPGSASCAVLVTTRSRMPDLAGSRFVDLDVLEPAEARDMFAGIIGPGRAEAEPEATDEVLTACAGLPLAIRIAGARLAARGGWSVRTIAVRLSDERRRLDWLKTGDLAVRACFEVSFTSLPGRRQRRGGPGACLPAARPWQGLVHRAARGGRPGRRSRRRRRGRPRGAGRCPVAAVPGARPLPVPRPAQGLRGRSGAAARRRPRTRDAAMRRLLAWYLHTVDARGADGVAAPLPGPAWPPPDAGVRAAELRCAWTRH